MKISGKDREILRGLAAEKAEVAALDVHKQRGALWCRLNRLEPVKPMVWINEICWHEMDVDGELVLHTSDHFCQGLERELRRERYQWNHMPGDMIVEDVIYCPIAVLDTGFGIVEESRKIFAHAGSVASREFEPQIREKVDIEKIKMPELSVDWEETEWRYETMTNLFGDIIRVEKRGIPGRWFAPWDELVRWWGVQDALLDLVLRPEMVHRAMDRLVSAYLSRLDQWEELNVLALNNTPIRVGSGGYGCTDELPLPDFEAGHIRAKDLWGCATAQIFSEVSPDMHEEFALQYERRWLERFGLTYYGCCEPLHLKIDLLKSIPNLRKISTSPWADMAETVEKTRGKYVISFKPNPALLVENPWEPDRVRAYLIENLEQAQGCPTEVILKDISTVNFEPKRLWAWAEIAREVTERFA